MLAVELAKYLHNQGIGIFDEQSASGNIFIQNLPSKPDNCLSIYHTGGTPTDSKLGYDIQTIQLILRGTESPQLIYNKLLNIFNKLHGLSSLELILDGSWIISCLANDVPAYIGQDQNGRHEYSLNLAFEVRNKSTNRE